jgi:hypothetical protein
MFLEKVSSFCKQLAMDKYLQLRFKNAQTQTEYQRICESFNLNFTEKELKEFSDFLSKSNLTDDDIQDLSEMELGAVVGGQQIYGTTILMRRGLRA